MSTSRENPTDMSNPSLQPNLADLLRAAIDRRQRQLHTALPGVVDSYDATTQTASVSLSVQLETAEGGTFERVPSLADVPVVWPGGAVGFFHGDLSAGDPVMCIFSEADFGGWLATGSVLPPDFQRRHGLNGVAVPGLRREPLPVTGGHVTIGGSELRLGSDTAANFVALANLVDAHLTTIQAAYDAHVHPTGVGPSGTTAAPIGALASVASAKVKSE